MSTPYLDLLPSALLKIVKWIGHEADRRKLPAYLVGGVVRDLLLKRQNLDLDFVVEGDAISLAREIAERNQLSLKTYEQFGTATLLWPKKSFRADIASCRKERYPHPGALPVVSSGRLYDDLFRRDFTINAMAIGINKDHWGKLIDEFGGREDLTKKMVRILHDQSFRDDPTRILRAVRFEQRFRCEIEPATLALLRQAINRNYPQRVKPPRYFSELKRTLVEDDPRKSLSRLKQLNCSRFVEASLNFSSKRLNEVRSSISQLSRYPTFSKEKHGWILYLMAMCESLSVLKVAQMASKFHFTKELAGSIKEILRSRALIRELSGKNLKPSDIYRILNPLTLTAIFYIRTKPSAVAIHSRIDHYLENDMAAELKINGEDLLKSGIQPGRVLGKILKEVLMEKIDHGFKTKKQELNFAKQCLSNGV